MPASRMGSRGNRRTNESRLKTDSDISAAAMSLERPLQRWSDDDVESTPAPELADLTLESSGGGKGWDQFATNREKFGIVPSYDERFYTTEIDRSHPDFAEREKRAMQLAKEIESQGHNGNVHLAEERGIQIDDSGLDEEDKYSGVDRTNAAKAFTAEESKKAMGSSTYLAEREAQDRKQDARKFKQIFNNSTVGQQVPSLEKLPDQGAKAADDSYSDKQSDTSKPKKKFNFAEAAAKASSFKSSVSPSPRQSFSPISVSSPTSLHPPVMAGGMPPVMAMPGAPPFMYAPPHVGMPGMSPVPQGAGVSPPAMKFHSTSPYNENGPEGTDDPTRSISPVKELKSEFDYFLTLRDKGESLPKMYATPPTWTTTSQVSYVDQFPVAVMAPRMPSFMPPVGFMLPPQY